MNKIKRLTLYDVLSPFIFIFIYPISLVYKVFLKIQNRKIILIMEDPMEACDNGYSFYKYLEGNLVRDSYYVIQKKSPHLKKFDSFDSNIVYYRSFKHWLFYLVAVRNYSIHKAGSPSPAIFYILHKYRILSANRVFLQHGIIMNDLPYLYKKECYFDYFITSSSQERNFIIDKFGYDESEVILTGLSRYDNLYNYSKSNNTIAIMPTWRSKLVNLNDEEFRDTDYFKNWSDFLSSKDFLKTTELWNCNVVFYLHRNLQKFSHLFENSKIDVLNREEINIDDIILESSMLITDYSSISFDFAFQKKPIIYFQFDYNEFRNNHLEEGYFSYVEDGFGKVLNTTQEVEKEVSEIIKRQYTMEKTYEIRVERFFPHIDNKNSVRIYKSTLERELRNDK